MTNYKITFKFKNEKELTIEFETDVNIRNLIIKEWGTSPNAILAVGDFIISTNDVLWVRIEGDNIE